MQAGLGALKCLSGVISVVVTLIFFVLFLMTKERRGGDIVAELPYLKDETKVFVAAQVDAFVIRKNTKKIRVTSAERMPVRH